MLGLQSGEVRESFRKEMENACEHAPDIDENRNVKEAWDAACTDIQGVASRVLGHGKRRQPDWFLESQSILEPLIEEKQLIHERMLVNDSASTRREFRAAQKSVSREVCRAKERWIGEVTTKAENAQKDGCTHWKSIRNCREYILGDNRLPLQRFTIKKVF